MKFGSMFAREEDPTIAAPGKDLPAQLSTTLPWDAWLEEYNCYITQQCNLLRVFEVTTLGSAFIAPEKISGAIDSLNGMLMKMLPGVSLQYIVKIDNDLEGFFREYLTYRGRSNSTSNPGRKLCRDILKMNVEHARGAVEKGYPKMDGRRLRRYRFFMTVMVPYPKMNKRLSKDMKAVFKMICPDEHKGIFTPSDAYLKTIHRDLSKLTGLLDQMSGIIRSSMAEGGLLTRQMEAGEGINLFYSFRNPERSSKPGLGTINTNDEQFIRQQVSFDPVEKSDSSIKVGKKHGIISTLAVQPISLKPSHFRRLLESIEEGHLTINATIQPTAKTSMKLLGRNILAQSAQFLPGGIVNDDSTNILDSIGSLRRMTSRGEGVYVTYSVIDCRWFSSGDMENEKTKIQAQWSSLGGESMPESDFAVPMWIRSLPGGYSAWDEIYDARNHLTSSLHLAAMLPAVWAWQGKRKKGVPIAESFDVSRLNELIPYSKWENETAHGVLVGTTGTGKSFLVNKQIIEDLACDATDVRVIDVGNSYGAIAEAMGEEFAQLVIFDMEEPICFNPFFGKGTASKIRNATAIIATMLIADPDVDKISAATKTVIMDAVQNTFKLKLDREPQLSDFVEILKEKEAGGVTGSLLVDVLKPFYGHGIYAGFFDGQMGFRGDLPFIVFELLQVKEDQRLMGPLFLVITDYLRSTMELSLIDDDKDSLDKRTIIRIDEAHNSMKNKLAADMINSFYAEGRKFNMGIWTVTQNLFKYLEFPGGDNMLAQSSSQITLSQDMEQTRGKANQLGLSDRKLRVIEGIQKREDFAYSEYLYSDASGTADERGCLLRFFCHPTPMMLYSTKTPDRTLRDRLKREFPDTPMIEIAQLMQDRLSH